jgi:hypothetical protein
LTVSSNQAATTSAGNHPIFPPARASIKDKDDYLPDIEDAGAVVAERGVAIARTAVAAAPLDDDGGAQSFNASAGIDRWAEFRAEFHSRTTCATRTNHIAIGRRDAAGCGAVAGVLGGRQDVVQVAPFTVKDVGRGLAPV